MSKITNNDLAQDALCLYPYSNSGRRRVKHDDNTIKIIMVLLLLIFYYDTTAAAATHVSPASDDIIDVILADRQTDDAPVDCLAAVFSAQFLVLHLDPAQRAHGEPDWIDAGVDVVEVGTAQTRRLCRTPSMSATATRDQRFKRLDQIV